MVEKWLDRIEIFLRAKRAKRSAKLASSLPLPAAHILIPVGLGVLDVNTAYCKRLREGVFVYDDIAFAKDQKEIGGGYIN